MSTSEDFITSSGRGGLVHIRSSEIVAISEDADAGVFVYLRGRPTPLHVDDIASHLMMLIAPTPKRPRRIRK